MRRITAFLLALALLVPLALTAYAQSLDGDASQTDTDTYYPPETAEDEPFEEPLFDGGEELPITDGEPIYEPGDENPGAPTVNGEIPETLPSIAPDVDGAGNPNTGASPLFAAAAVAGAAAIAVLAAAVKKPGRK